MKESKMIKLVINICSSVMESFSYGQLSMVWLSKGKYYVPWLENSYATNNLLKTCAIPLSGSYSKLIVKSLLLVLRFFFLTLI